MTPYDPHAIEAKWRERWPRERMSYQLNDGDQPYYSLDMFSYPSGEGLHMGHWRPYTIADVWSRYQTLLGKKVLHPVGFDSFGLPAENHAIKTKTHPAEHTQKAITNFQRQLTDMGTMYDWSTYIETSSPEYYRWTQWIFLQLYKHGLAYRKAAQVNWCPSCQTVLANEQVIAGRCERCGTEVMKKELRQWFFKITDFADDLLNFDELDWPERVKTLQREWIGKSEGAELQFRIKNSESSIDVFTTRADTLYGVTYVVLAPEHKLVDQVTTLEQRDAVKAYQEAASKKSDIDRMASDKLKTGVFTGSYAINPATNQEVPIWIADYVLGSYGTGAVMAVPAHDERDYAFASTYNLPIKHVISSPNDQEYYTGHGILVIKTHPQTYQFAQLVDTRQQPLASVPVNVVYDNHVDLQTSDTNGYIQLYYPLPTLLRVTKAGDAQQSIPINRDAIQGIVAIPLVIPLGGPNVSATPTL